MKKVKYNGKEIFVDDSELDINETGVIIRHKKDDDSKKEASNESQDEDYE